MFFAIEEHVVPACHIREYPGATAHSQEEVLHLHVKQYIPLEVLDDTLVQVSLVGAHAIGFPKVGGTSQVPQSSFILAGGLRALVGRNLHEIESTRIRHTQYLDGRCGQSWSQLRVERAEAWQ